MKKININEVLKLKKEGLKRWLVTNHTTKTYYISNDIDEVIKYCNTKPNTGYSFID